MQMSSHRRLCTCGADSVDEERRKELEQNM